MTKTLITGASGYIGGRLAEFLSSQSNYDIILGSRNIQKIIRWLPKANVVQMIWESDHSLEEACTSVDNIVHRIFSMLKIIPSFLVIRESLFREAC